MCQRDDVDMYIYRNLKISTIFEKEIFFDISTSFNFFNEITKLHEI